MNNHKHLIEVFEKYNVFTGKIMRDIEEAVEADAKQQPEINPALASALKQKFTEDDIKSAVAYGMGYVSGKHNLTQDESEIKECCDKWLTSITTNSQHIAKLLNEMER